MTADQRADAVSPEWHHEYRGPFVATATGLGVGPCVRCGENPEDPVHAAPPAAEAAPQMLTDEERAAIVGAPAAPGVTEHQPAALAVIEAACAWYDRIDYDGGSPPNMWADEEDMALIEAVQAYRAAGQVRTPPDPAEATCDAPGPEGTTCAREYLHTPHRSAPDAHGVMQVWTDSWYQEQRTAGQSAAGRTGDSKPALNAVESTGDGTDD